MLEKLGELPKKILWSEPTPLEPAVNLAQELGAGNIWIKRDDCNGLAFGGNKVRQMEYYIGDALQRGADTLLITGATQSNFVRTAAAACAKSNLECHVQLEKRVAKDDHNYLTSGNVLVDQLMGATLHSYPVGEDEEGADRNLEEIADGLRNEGKNPYVVHLSPTHPPLGALGYIEAALETTRQIEMQGLNPDLVFIPSGSGSTHSGFLYGWRAVGNTVPVQGVCVRRAAEIQTQRIAKRLEQIGELLEETPAAKAEHVLMSDEFLAPGYGYASTAVKEAIALAARREALILDPVYTGKTFATAFDFVRKNPGCNIVILHSGGTPAIFAYESQDLLP